MINRDGGAGFHIVLEGYPARRIADSYENLRKQA